MLVKTLPLGPYETNCYIVTDENTLECAVIDPGDESNTVLNYIEANRLIVKYILITHGHFDHTGAVEEVRLATGTPVFIHSMDAYTQAPGGPFQFYAAGDTRFYGEGDAIAVGGLIFTVLDTPGHSPGSVTLQCENCLFTGDTLFRDSCGRTDLQGGDMRVLLGSLRRLHDLEGDFEVYPGHGEASSLVRERGVNYYMKYAVEN